MFVEEVVTKSSVPSGSLTWLDASSPLVAAPSTAAPAPGGGGGEAMNTATVIGIVVGVFVLIIGGMAFVGYRVYSSESTQARLREQMTFKEGSAAPAKTAASGGAGGTTDDAREPLVGAEEVTPLPGPQLVIP